MREPERIDRIMAKLQEIWKQCPDLRFLQLSHMLVSQFNAQKGFIYSDTMYEKIESEHSVFFLKKSTQPDLFNVEDYTFEEFLDDWLEEHKEE